MELIKMEPFSQPSMVEAIVEIYQQSFGGEPWNEGYLCLHCRGTFAWRPQRRVCPVCGELGRQALLVEYWPRRQILSDLYRELGKPGAICLVAKQGDGSIVGFTWGYEVSIGSELSASLEAPGLDLELVGDFFYLDECAVLPACQGQGLGRALIGAVMEQSGHCRFLLRTMAGSKMARIIEHLGGQVVQQISRGRVIMTVALA